MRSSFFKFNSVVTALAYLLLAAGSLRAQRLDLHIVDLSTGVGVPEATVELARSGRRVVGDNTGWVRIEGLQAGALDASVHAPGYARQSVRIQVDSTSLTIRREIYLEPETVELPAFTARGTLDSEDQDARARRTAATPVEQLTGDALRDVANADLGDALEKIAGVSVDSSEGTVSGINIRGAGARQTRITIDGQSAAGGGGRGTTRGAGALSQVPREFVERIQVMKATTPDMDADAIGGSVDLQTSRISLSKAPRTTLSLRSRRDAAFPTWAHSASLAHAQPFALPGKRRLGLLLTLNVEDRRAVFDEYRVLSQWPTYETRWSDFESPTTAPGERFLARFRPGRNESERQSYGLVLNTDLRLSAHHHFYFKSLYTHNRTEIDQENLTYDFASARDLIALTPEGGTFEALRLSKQLSSREPEATTRSLVFGGEHEIAEWKLEHSIGYSAAEDDEQAAPSGIFNTARDFDGSYNLATDPTHPLVQLSRQDAPSGSDFLFDPADFAFSRLSLIGRSSRDAELALRLNAERSFERADGKWILKSGLKARIREGESDVDQDIYNLAGDRFTLEAIPRPSLGALYDGRYDVGPGGDARALLELFEEDPGRFRYDPISAVSGSATSDFAVDESIYAAYGMFQREWARWTLVGGLRIEHTETETRGFESVMGRVDGERTVEIEPVSTEASYTGYFPGLHFLYYPSPSWSVRGSLTRTLQRPDFRDLSPSTRVNTDNKTIRSGNPELDPFDARAIDLGLDFHVSTWGTFSVGLFYKRIEDFIVDVEESVEYLGESGYTRSSPVNGSPADLFGLEGAWSVDLNFLPGVLERTSFNLNYTLTDSTAAYPGYPGAETMLPEQVEQTFNARLNWKFRALSFSLRTRYRGLQLRDLIEPGQDQYSRGYWSHSLSGSYEFNPSTLLSLGLSNLNEPEVYLYQGHTGRPVRNRPNSLNVSLSLSVRFGG